VSFLSRRSVSGTLNVPEMKGWSELAGRVEMTASEGVPVPFQCHMRKLALFDEIKRTTIKWDGKDATRPLPKV
jgi:hypothetical protein